MKQQDLVWLSLPFSNLMERKVRPAIIVSNDGYNETNQDVVVCAVTSNLEEKNYSVPIDNGSLTQGRLPVKSKIRADKIMQVEKTLILSTFARVNSAAYDILMSEIKKLTARKQ
jgi:mRNA interferase MazF